MLMISTENTREVYDDSVVICVCTKLSWKHTCKWNESLDAFCIGLGLYKKRRVIHEDTFAYCIAGGAENAGVENAGVENTGAKTYGKPSKQKINFII